MALPKMRLVPLIVSLLVSVNALKPDNSVIVNTHLGQARGVSVGGAGSVVRFVVKYATASRFADPIESKEWIGR